MDTVYFMEPMTPTKIEILNGLMQLIPDGSVRTDTPNSLETRNVCVKCSPDLVEEIDNYCQLTGFTKSAFVRHAIVMLMEEVDAQYNQFVKPHIDAQNRAEVASHD